MYIVQCTYRQIDRQIDRKKDRWPDLFEFVADEGEGLVDVVLVARDGHNPLRAAPVAYVNLGPALSQKYRLDSQKQKDDYLQLDTQIDEHR